jgi:hypothetical protein
MLSPSIRIVADFASEGVGIKTRSSSNDALAKQFIDRVLRVGREFLAVADSMFGNIDLFNFKMQ